MALVVVGVDGTPGSLETLLLADAEARWRNAGLEVVHVHPPLRLLDGQPQVAVAAATMWTGSVMPQPRDAVDAMRIGGARQAQQAHDDAVGRVRRCVTDAGLHRRGIDVTVVADQQPARVLLRVARTADLLVLGGGRSGRLGGAAAGAVARQCLRHARCPVLLVGSGRSSPLRTRDPRLEALESSL